MGARRISRKYALCVDGTAHRCVVDDVIVVLCTMCCAQVAAIEGGVDIVVGTPGRLQDLVDRRTLVCCVCACVCTH
jgi:hypothetical protein